MRTAGMKCGWTRLITSDVPKRRCASRIDRRDMFVSDGALTGAAVGGLGEGRAQDRAPPIALPGFKASKFNLGRGHQHSHRGQGPPLLLHGVRKTHFMAGGPDLAKEYTVVATTARLRRQPQAARTAEPQLRRVTWRSTR